MWFSAKHYKPQKLVRPHVRSCGVILIATSGPARSTDICSIHKQVATCQRTYAARRKWCLHSADEYLRKLVGDYSDKSELARKLQLAYNRIDQFIEGTKDLSPTEKQGIATTLGLDRTYESRTDTLMPIQTIAQPISPPASFEQQDWRKQQIPDLRHGR